MTRIIRKHARIATGTYTGDGTTSRAVTGIGFHPKYVKIWRKIVVDGTGTTIVETTEEILDDHAEGGAIVHIAAGAHEFQKGKIISFDPDGFTVDDDGANENPNKSGVDYNYVVWG